MKKVLRILLITLGAILLLLILIPVLFKSRIETAVKQKINENVYATVDWSRFSLSLFRGFPDLSVNLHHVSVVGLEDFQGDTLAALSRFELRVNPFSAISGNLEVKAILLDQPLINGIVLADGTANWDIANVSESGEMEEELDAEDGKGTSMGVSLQRLAILDGRIYYKDAVMEMDASLENLDLELSGDLSIEETVLHLEAGVKRVNATQGGIRYLRDATFGIDLEASANMVEQTYSMLENEIRLNALVLGIEGVVDMMENGAMDMDLRFFTRETSFQTLLSMVPAIYLKDFESLEARGTLGLEGTIKGVMLDSLLPDARISLEVSDGYFSYPDLPKDVSDVQIRLVANYNGKEMDQSTVDLERFHLLLGGNPFEVMLHVDHPISDMHVAGSVKGVIDFASLKDVVPLEGVEMEGKMTANLDLDTRMSFIEQEKYEEVNLDGSLLIEGVMLHTPEIPVPVHIQKMEMYFNPRFVELAGLDLVMGSSDLQLEGKLSNFIPYVFEGKTVSGSLAVSSRMLDANELMPAEAEADTTVAAQADSMALPAQVKIPENIDFKLGLDMKKVIYEEIQLENIRGEIAVSGGVASLKGLQVEVIEGRVTADGTVDTRGEYTEADLVLEMTGVDIPSSYATFVTVERLAPMAKFCKGSANMKLNYHSLLDASFSPLYESMNANGRIFTRNLQIYNTNSFVRLSELLKNDKFREMAPDDMDIKFRVRDGRVIVDPFDLEFSDSRMVVSGSHGIDLTMNYQLDMAIAKSDLGAGANDVMNSVTALAAGAGLKIPESDFLNVKAKITGTFKEPKVSTDLSGNLQAGKNAVKEAVEERVKEEIEKVEEQVREDAGEKAEEILKKAEQESERIMEEARKQGEALVKEAKKQGDALVKEAGSNPLKKVAAQESSKELVRQAEKQSEKLIQEAQLKSDKIMQQAREEAERI
ncbi:MAG: AsmA-like C-terminal region-containing protein [Bacteroidota bacterium]